MEHYLYSTAKRALELSHAIKGVLLWIAVPAALLPPIPTQWKWILTRTAIITAGVWIFYYQIRMHFELAWELTVLDMDEPGNMYDGQLGNIFATFLGWAPPLLECLIVFSLTQLSFYLWDKKTKKKPA